MDALLGFFAAFAFSSRCRDFERTDPLKAKRLVANQYLDTAQVVGQVHQRHAYLGACKTNGS